MFMYISGGVVVLVCDMMGCNLTLRKISVCIDRLKNKNEIVSAISYYFKELHTTSTIESFELRIILTYYCTLYGSSPIL